MIGKGVEVHFSAHFLGSRIGRGRGTSCTGLLCSCAVLLSGSGSRCWCGRSRFGVVENTLHLADAQWFLDLRRGDRRPSLSHGD